MHKPTASGTMKSFSLADLRTIVKQMIGGTLDDAEQMSKLHRAIYEELYFDKMSAIEGEVREENVNKISSRKIFKIVPTKIVHDATNQGDTEKSTQEEAKTTDTHGCKDSILSDSDNYKEEQTVNESAEISIIRCPQNKGTYIEKPEESITSNRSEKNEKSSSNEKSEKSSSNENSEKSMDDNVLRNEQAFNIWSKEKTKAIKRALKEERKKKQEELTAKQEKTEKKRAAHEAYLSSKKLVEKHRKLEEAQRRIKTEDYSKIQDQENARIIANEEAFKAWIKRKNGASIRRHSPLQKCRPQTAKTNYCSDEIFDIWLDQLDSVLHQKYLRERRYLVRSFYCQPAYFGTAALSMQ